MDAIIANHGAADGARQPAVRVERAQVADVGVAVLAVVALLALFKPVVLVGWQYFGLSEPPEARFHYVKSVQMTSDEEEELLANRNPPPSRTIPMLTVTVTEAVSADFVADPTPSPGISLDASGLEGVALWLVATVSVLYSLLSTLGAIVVAAYYVVPYVLKAVSNDTAVASSVAEDSMSPIAEVVCTKCNPRVQQSPESVSQVIWTQTELPLMVSVATQTLEPLETSIGVQTESEPAASPDAISEHLEVSRVSTAAAQIKEDSAGKIVSIVSESSMEPKAMDQDRETDGRDNEAEVSSLTTPGPKGPRKRGTRGGKKVQKAKANKAAREAAELAAAEQSATTTSSDVSSSKWASS